MPAPFVAAEYWTVVRFLGCLGIHLVLTNRVERDRHDPCRKGGPTMAPSLINWGEGEARAWGERTHVARHDLDGLDLFARNGIARIIDAMPRSAVHAYTMGDDPCDGATWRRGDVADLTGLQLLDIVDQGRLWLNIVGAGHHVPELGATVDELYGEVSSTVGDAWSTLKATLLVSSPSAQVFYHADNQPNALWHIRGEKKVFVYPRREPYVSVRQLDSIAAGYADEQLPYDPAWDASAEVIDLQPGEVAWWPQNSPHRVVNAPGEPSVSLSVEHRTTASTRTERRQRADFHLRRTFGLTPPPGKWLDPVTLVAGSALAKVAPKQRARNERAVSFVVDPEAEGGVKSLA